MIGAVVGGIAGSRFGFHKLTFLSVFALSQFWSAFCSGRFALLGAVALSAMRFSRHCLVTAILL